MKALLLSAGFGTRLRPLTLQTPKCLIEVKGKPILEHWLVSLEKIGVDKILINTHFKRDKVLDYLEKRRKTKTKIIECFEQKLLGTAGTLLKNKESLKGSEISLMHADNYTNFNLDNLLSRHKKRPLKCLLTMITFVTENPKSCGIVETNNEGIVTDFFEKVENPPSNIANGAIYIFDSSLIKYIEKNMPNAKDFSVDVIPYLIGRIFTCHVEEPFIDIGTPETLRKANKS